MSFFDSLHSKNAKRQFLMICILATILIVILHLGLTILIQWVRKPPAGSITLTIPLLEAFTILTGGLFAGVITAAFLMFISNFLYQPEENLKTVECIDPRSTLELHKAALSETEYWLHSGHIGRWVRVHVIPALASTARDRGIKTRIVFHIIDPNNLLLCTQYSEYRSHIKYREKGFITVDDTRAELLATVLRACIAKSEHPGLEIEIYFKPSMHHTRLDICSSMAFLTMIDPRSPAVVYRNAPSHRQHSFYDALRMNLDSELACAQRFSPTAIFSRAGLNRSSVIKFFNDNNLTYIDSKGFIEHVVKRVLSEYTPYE